MKNNNIKIKFSIIDIIIASFLLIISCSPTDWEYGYYYYVKIESDPKIQYVIQVPLPCLEYMRNDNRVESRILDMLVDSLTVSTGKSVYKEVEYNNQKYLEIRGCSTFVISSLLNLWDINLRPSLITIIPNQTMIYSDNNNIKIISEIRRVTKTNELKTWDLLYSVVTDPTQSPPFFTKNTWHKNIRDNNFISLKKGWHPYPVKEGKISIK